MELTIWIFLTVIAVILLVVYFNSKNSVWGGFTIGVILGIIIFIVYSFMGNGFEWIIIGKVAISGTILGFLADLLGKTVNSLKKNKYGKRKK